MAELVDAQDLKSCGNYIPVPVRVRPSVLVKIPTLNLAKRNALLSSIQKLVGHENIRITEKHYLSDQNDTLIRAMQTLEVNNRLEHKRNVVELLN